jgi:predicted transcriptional regulator
MSDQDRAPSVRLSDPRALRAYAHPTRMALVALLRRDGPQTATQAALAVGESVASCSFHLRQLAKYGLVEEAGGGRGREKPWRATAMFTDVDPADMTDPTVEAAAQAVQLAIAGQYFELLARWLRTQPGEPAPWREAAQIGDVTLPLTAPELRDLGERMRDLVRPYLDRLGDTGRHPAGSRPVTVVHMAFPSPITPSSGPAGHAPDSSGG